MLKNILYFLLSIAIFIGGTILYGALLNLREISLEDALKQKGIKSFGKVLIELDRKNFKLNLYSDSILVKSYRAVFGMNPKVKQFFSDEKATPVGLYKICGIIEEYKYYKFFRLNYPNKEDADILLKENKISKSERDAIVENIDSNICSIEKFDEKNAIGIHGVGKFNFIFKNIPFVYNWTNGSAALCDEDIDELSTFLKAGADVLIKNQ